MLSGIGQDDDTPEPPEPGWEYLAKAFKYLELAKAELIVVASHLDPSGTVFKLGQQAP